MLIGVSVFDTLLSLVQVGTESRAVAGHPTQSLPISRVLQYIQRCHTTIKAPILHCYGAAAVLLWLAALCAAVISYPPMRFGPFMPCGPTPYESEQCPADTFPSIQLIDYYEASGRAHIPGISTLGISIKRLLIKVSATVSNRAAPTVLIFRWTAARGDGRCISEKGGLLLRREAS